MSIYEYNEEYVKKTLFEDGYDAGKLDGIEKGMEMGNWITLVNSVEAVMKNMNINLEQACKILDVSVEDYHKAKDNIIQP
ncbi:MAG: hypothetical protein J6B68_00350 [Lachnospiraceae bacterium]|nr:hypothetical protein [Lachnospiraceae bacterium]